MIETILSILLTTAVTVGAGSLFKSSWDRFRCAQLAFEAAHEALLGAKSSLNVVIQEDSRQIVALTHCGRVTERVGFRKLEALR